jgi:hypothetical protein
VYFSTVVVPLHLALFRSSQDLEFLYLGLCYNFLDSHYCRQRQSSYSDPHQKGIPPVDGGNHERHPIVSKLIRAAESAPSKHVRGCVQVYLTFMPVVDYERVGTFASRRWQVVIGLPVLALLSIEEIEALLLQRGIELFHPPTPAHPWLCHLHRRAILWRAALPPHAGLFSMTHWVIEWLLGF